MKQLNYKPMGSVSLSLFSVVKSDSKMLCECDAPLIRTSDKGGEYCGYCENDLD